MPGRNHFFLSAYVAAPLLATLLVPRFATAQTVTALNNGRTYRLDAKGNDVTSHERPQNLNPTGISFSDCITDMSLGFPVSLSGFAGQGLEVWVGTADCTTDAARGRSGQLPFCWKVAQLGAMNVQTTNSTQINVRMQNIVGPQGSQPNELLVNEGSSACYAQQSYSSVQFNVAFVPVNSTGLLAGTAATFAVNTDLVGPPAPFNISISAGDGLLVLGWAPNSDPDTAGYDVYVGSTAHLIAASGGDAGYTLVCNEGGASDASSVSGCVNIGNAAPAARCGDNIFSQGYSGSGTVIPVTATEDAAATTSVSGGGISQTPTQYLVDANGTTSMTVSSPTVGHYDITGLTNGTDYSAVVAAVDAFGNIGPPSVEMCDTPRPIDGGRNGGSRTLGGCSCELEGASVPPRTPILSALLGALAFGLFRRRRSRTTLASSAQRAYTKPA